MNVRKLILSGALVALMGFVTTGCNENPTDPVDNGISGLAASSQSASSVALTWTSVAGATGYTVSWQPVSSTTAASGSMTVTAPPAVATNLAANTAYRFTVTATGATASGSIEWAGATRHTGTTNTPQSIRIYEKASAQPSGVNLNVNGVPQLVSLATSATGARAQLAMFIYQRAGQSNPDSVIVGPVYALPEYKISADGDFSRMDTAVYISGTTFQTASLDSWYLNQPLNQLITAGSNVMAYTFKPNAAGTIAGGHGFVVRTGVAGNYNYSRVVIKNLGGSILGGSGTNRYIEIEISYQDAANVPYAKPGMRPNPVGVPAAVVPY